MQLDPLHRKDNNLVNYGVLLVSGSDSDYMYFYVCECTV